MNSNSNYIIGIDASRCRSGGAVAHILGIISNLNPNDFSIKKIFIWGSQDLLNKLPNYPWLIKKSPFYLEKNIFLQVFWQLILLQKDFKKNNCDLLFTLDASTLCQVKNQVVLSQDLLSYEPGLLTRLKWDFDKIRLKCILVLQNAAFRRALGVIFLTEYAAKTIQNSCGGIDNYKIISHGVDSKFKSINRNNSRLNNPINCLYISNTSIYKNQWHVVKSIELLRIQGYNISLTLVGGGSGIGQVLLEKQIKISDPKGLFVKQIEFVPQSKLSEHLAQADIFIFASECEAFGITLLEAMASGIPIACSNRSCLPELLEGSGILFDPHDPSDIANSIKNIVTNADLRRSIASEVKQLANKYSWEKCSQETFSYIIEVIKKRQEYDTKND